MKEEIRNSKFEIRNSKSDYWALVMLVGLVVMVLAGLGGYAWWSPRSRFLPPSSTAQWIHYPVPPQVATTVVRHEQHAVFRCTFDLETAPAWARLRVCAFQDCSIQVNARPISLPSREHWNQVRTLDIAEQLRTGTNDLRAQVKNDVGPPILWLFLEGPNWSIRSDDQWRVILDGAAECSAHVAGKPLPLRPGNGAAGGNRTLESLQARWPTLLFFAFLSAAGWFGVQGRLCRKKTVPFSPLTTHRSPLTMSPLSVGLLAACLLWVLLFSHNLLRTPRFPCGFDAAHHLQYIQYVQDHWTLPLADQGWEMHQPPLFYLLSAFLLRVCGLSSWDPGAVVVLRLMALAAGLVQLVLSAACLRSIFPGQQRRQLYGLALAAFLPAQIYTCHYLTNEWLLTTLGTAALYLSLRVVRDEQPSMARHVLLGLCLGAALLTKVTALVPVGVVFLVLAARLRKETRRRGEGETRRQGEGETRRQGEGETRRQGEGETRRQGEGETRRGRDKECLRVFVSPCLRVSVSPCLRVFVSPCLRVSVSLLTALAVSGWHYARVWAHFGTPLVGNYDVASGFWFGQQPGYGTFAFLGGFGHSLIEPFFSAFASLPDGLYSTLWGDGLCGGVGAWCHRPPWNYDLMAAGFGLALVPTLAIVLGLWAAIGAWLRRPQAEWLLLFGLAGGLIVALVYQFLRYPYYGHGRASYLLTGMVPLCALGALGLDFLARFHRVLGFVLVILLGTWAGTVYTSFWIDPNGAATHNWAGEQLLKSKLPFQAQQCFRKAIEVDPAFVPARFNLANTLLLTNQRTRAREETEAILRNHPDHADALLLLAILCHREGQTQAALDQLRRACRAAPDHPVVYSASAGFLMEQGQEEEAITAFRQALRVNPASATDHANLGLLLVRMGSLEEAITQYGCAMDLQPDHPEWRADLAWILATRLPPRSKPYATLAVDE